MTFLPPNYEHRPKKKIKPTYPNRDLTERELKKLFELDITNAKDTEGLERIVTVMDVFANDITHLAGVRCEPKEILTRIHDLKRLSISVGNHHE